MVKNRVSSTVKLQGLDKDDISKIELWYKRGGGRKNGTHIIEKILKRETSNEPFIIRSIKPIDDVSFLLTNTSKTLLVSLILNTGSKSSVIITTDGTVKELAFTLSHNLLKDKISITKNLILENEAVYRRAFNEQIYGTKENFQKGDVTYEKEDEINGLKEIRELCTQVQDFSVLGEYCMDENKRHLI